jgi:GNAT superfamily N-acetyltransferase
MIVTDSPTEENEKFLFDQLNIYNDQHRIKDGKRLAIYKKDTEGNIYAGLTGITFLSWLHLDVLWVQESERTNNIGSALLAKAETIATERGCIGVNFETYSYQALEFYIKHGYEEFGCLTGYGPHTRHFLKKML